MQTHQGTVAGHAHAAELDGADRRHHHAGGTAVELVQIGAKGCSLDVDVRVRNHA